MLASSQATYLTPDKYLQMEEQSPIKHEYIEGEVYAMAGASDSHVTVAGNLFILLQNHVRGSGYRVYISDMKTRLEQLNRFYYPDVMVTCDPRDQETATYKRFPCLIVEVLSDSTEAFGRAACLRHCGDKFADYQTLETLQEYVLINTKKPRVECFRRTPEGFWMLQSYTLEQESFGLQSLNFQGMMATLYEDVVFES